MRYLFITLTLLLSLTARGQQEMHPIIPQDILVKMPAGRNPHDLTKDFQVFGGEPTGLRPAEQISPSMNIWLLHYENKDIAERDLMTAIGRHALAEIVQLNYIHQERGCDRMESTTPNDPEFMLQWQYINNGTSGGVVDADIDADLAWDITTGGVTPLGDTIVVCVVDGGVSYTHEDFGDNIWLNYDEIPGNGVDDDLNGYVDDYRGWNAAANNDNIVGDPWHGTCVAGIVGAQGDNGVGVSGVNWNIKVMCVVNAGNYNSANVIESYSYPYMMRKRYNQTGGQQGAFVVATNSSWGVDFGQPADEPLWCAFYDSLGAIGILSAGATANVNTNVDLNGDLPTACASDHMISVTNLARNDNKVTAAGYGVTTIDLGAYGEQTYTLSSPNGYAPFGGTSGATPHVAGTVGLLYSAPCPSFALLAKTNPAQASLLAKQYIMDGTDPNVSIATTTVTGGKLNANGALNELLADCSSVPCFPPFNVTTSTLTDVAATVIWTELDTTASYVVMWGLMGGGAVFTDTVTGPSFSLSGLFPCTNYEITLQTLCDTANSNLSSPFYFRTDGCCEAPVSASVGSILETSAIIEWPAVLAANSYNVEYREVGVAAWSVFTQVLNTQLMLTGLDSCTEYEYRIRTNCDTGTTAPGPVFSFRTIGCRGCAQPYCTVVPPATDDEWIASFGIGTYQNNSGDDSGYNLFSGTGIILEQGQSYTASFTPGYTGFAYGEVFRLWIDYNADGDFSDAGEQVYTSPSTTQTITTQITIPATATPGSTRMRVSMKWQSASTLCTDYDYGEIEEYCIDIALFNSVASSPASLSSVSVFPNPFNDQLNLDINLNTAETVSAEVLSIDGRTCMTFPSQDLSSGTHRLNLEAAGQLAPGMYIIRVRTKEGSVALKAIRN